MPPRPSDVPRSRSPDSNKQVTEEEAGMATVQESIGRSYGFPRPPASHDPSIQTFPLGPTQGAPKSPRIGRLSSRPPGAAPLSDLLQSDPDPPEQSSAPRGRREEKQPVRHGFFDPARDTTSDVAPALVESSSTPSANPSRYRLKILQQPAAARACGFGERDRRVIDPPPILQLLLDNYDPESEEDRAKLEDPYNVVHCSLYSVEDRNAPESEGHDVSTIRDPNNTSQQVRRLMGTLAANPFVCANPDISEWAPRHQRMGVYYIFPDISCRHHGLYRLSFRMLGLHSNSMDPGASTDVAATVTSDVFEVYSAKDFPGMQPSTPLTRWLKAQGVHVSVKKGNDGRALNRSGKQRKSQSRTNADESGNSESEREEAGPSTQRP